MEISITEAATLLGKSYRQIRYLIRTGKLPAKKVGTRWRIESAALPLSDAERQELAQRSELARRAFERALEPAVKASRPKARDGVTQDESPGSEPSKRSYSVTDLLAFQDGEEIYRALVRGRGRDDRISRTLFETLALVTRGCHCYHPREKAARFGEARELAATVVAELLLEEDDGDAAGRRALATRVEQELIPKLAGLVAAYEKRGRQKRFDGFGRKTFESGSS